MASPSDDIDQALAWLERDLSDRDSRIREAFPRLDIGQLLARLLEMWPSAAERGSFRAAVAQAFLESRKWHRLRFLPQVKAILLSPSQSVYARSLALDTLESWDYRLIPAEEAIAPHDLEAIRIDSASDCAPVQPGPFEPRSMFFEESLWHEDYQQLERLRRYAGAPYSLTWYRSTLHGGAAQETILSRIAADRCATSIALLLYVSFEATEARTVELLRAAVCNMEGSVSSVASARRDDGFSPARFWRSNLNDAFPFLASWTPSIRPGGNLAALVLGRDGLSEGFAVDRVVGVERAEEMLGPRATGICAAEALEIFRDAWSRFRPRFPLAGLERGPTRVSPPNEFCPAAMIEDAAIQTMIAGGSE
jgi:hypothetical protein